MNDNFPRPTFSQPGETKFDLLCELSGVPKVRQKKFLMDLHFSGYMRESMTQRDFILLFLDLELREA